CFKIRRNTQGKVIKFLRFWLYPHKSFSINFHYKVLDVSLVIIIRKSLALALVTYCKSLALALVTYCKSLALALVTFFQVLGLGLGLATRVLGLGLGLET